jgi:3-oxoadipate enol-lactonase
MLLLSNSLGTTLDAWTKQIAPLSRSFRVVRYDTRGHGRSVVSPAPYSLDLLGRDALAVLDAVGARRAHVCGLSLGGLTAMWLAVNARERVDRLVLANTAARIATVEAWDQRIRDVRTLGLAANLRGWAATLVHRGLPPARARGRRGDAIHARGLRARGLPGMLRCPS